MKIWKLIYIPIITILSTLGTIKILDSVNSISNQNHKKKIINGYVIKLKSCFDLENKNKRKTHESLKLIEYCVKEFGVD